MIWILSTIVFEIPIAKAQREPTFLGDKPEKKRLLCFCLNFDPPATIVTRRRRTSWKPTSSGYWTFQHRSTIRRISLDGALWDLNVIPCHLMSSTYHPACSNSPSFCSGLVCFVLSCTIIDLHTMILQVLSPFCLFIFSWSPLSGRNPPLSFSRSGGSVGELLPSPDSSRKR